MEGMWLNHCAERAGRVSCWIIYASQNQHRSHREIRPFCPLFHKEKKLRFSSSSSPAVIIMCVFSVHAYFQYFTVKAGSSRRTNLQHLFLPVSTSQPAACVWSDDVTHAPGGNLERPARRKWLSLTTSNHLGRKWRTRGRTQTASVWNLSLWGGGDCVCVWVCVYVCVARVITRLTHRGLTKVLSLTHVRWNGRGGVFPLWLDEPKAKYFAMSPLTFAENRWKPTDEQ